MSSLNALKVAVEVATRQRDAARQALQDTLRIQQAGRAQLDQLSGYAQETQHRWGLRADTTVQPEVMYHHYQFMDRLEHAIGLQTGVVGDQAQRVELARRALLDSELRLASLQKVVERKQHELAVAQMRREQKQTDERAALRLASGTATANFGPFGQEH